MSNVVKTAMAASTVAFLSACGPDPTMTMGTEKPVGPVVSTQPGPSLECTVEVNRVGVFADTLAYSGRRGIYRFVDHCTGKEYIGVSGIGVAEDGSHMAGKNHVTDER